MVPVLSGFLSHPTTTTSGLSGFSHHQYERVDSCTVSTVSQPNIFKLVPEHQPEPEESLKPPRDSIDQNLLDHSDNYVYDSIDNTEDTAISECIDTTIDRAAEVTNIVNNMDPLIEADSDNEDDPTKLLNQWLGELNSLKKVLLFWTYTFI